MHKKCIDTFKEFVREKKFSPNMHHNGELVDISKEKYNKLNCILGIMKRSLWSQGAYVGNN
jgi:hypothetical protein